MHDKYQDAPVLEDEPWRDDIFERREHGQRIAMLIASFSKPHVISVKADWGTGKSVFLRRLAAHIERQGIPAITVDAWKTDYLDDPLLAFVSAVNDRLSSHLKKHPDEALRAKARTTISNLANFGSKLIVPTVKVLTAAIPGAKEIVDAGAELVGQLGETMLEWEKSQRTAEKEFRRNLIQVRTILTGSKDGRLVTKPIAFIIDELDRCRPDYAMKALERIKHFFDVEGIIFVIATDKANLPAAVQSVYGTSEDHAERYLRRFIDIEYSLPAPNNKAFSLALADHFELGVPVREADPAVLKTTYMEAYELPGAYKALYRDDRFALNAFELIEVFPRLADAWSLSLRDQAQAFNLASLILKTTPGSSVCFPQVLAFLCCLRFHSPDSYWALAAGTKQLGSLIGVMKPPITTPHWLQTNDQQGADILAFVDIQSRAPDAMDSELTQRVRDGTQPDAMGAAYHRLRTRVGPASKQHIPGFARSIAVLARAFTQDGSSA